jgi:hypothetical protein
VVVAGAADTPLVNPQEHAPSHLAPGRVPPGVWRRVSKGGVWSFIIGRRRWHDTSGDGTPGRRSGRREAALPKSTGPAHPCSAARPDHRRDADSADRDADYCGDPAEGRGARAVKEVRAAEQTARSGAETGRRNRSTGFWAHAATVTERLTGEIVGPPKPLPITRV